MFFPVDQPSRARAKGPHELAMVNLLLFNLLIGVVLLAGSMARPDSLIGTHRWAAMAVPLVLSLVVIGLTWLRASRAEKNAPWFVAAHWKLAASRYRLLLGAYLVCGAILSIPLFAGGSDEARIEEHIKGLAPAMQQMERRKLESQDMRSAVWARIAVVPLLLTVMVTIMLESGALYQAGRGELPDGLVKQFPPPADLKGSDCEITARDETP